MMTGKEKTNDEILTDLADMLGDDDPTYLAVASRLRPPEHVEAEPKPPENRPAWLDIDSRVGAGMDDDQRQAEKAHRKETDAREEALLNAIQDGDDEAVARISGKSTRREMYTR